MAKDQLELKKDKQITLTPKGALLLIDIITDMDKTPIWQYPALTGLHGLSNPPAYRRYRDPDATSPGYRAGQHFFPDHQLAFTATWARALKDQVQPVKSPPNRDLTHRENKDANWIAALLVLLSQIHKRKIPMPSTIWSE